MRYIFLGLLWDPKQKEIILRKEKVASVHPEIKFQWSLIRGIEKNIGSSIDVINFLPVGTFPGKYNDLILKSKEWVQDSTKGFEIGCINLPFLKQFSRSILLKRYLSQDIDVNKEVTFFVYSLYLPFLYAVKRLNKNSKVIVIVPDLPQFYDLQKTFFIKRIARKINSLFISRLLQRIDFYVLLTKYMAKKLNVADSNYVVVEGCADLNYFNNKDVFKKNIVLYSGTLNYKYGIKEFIEAFLKCNNSLFELWICGTGEAESYIKQVAKIHNKIKFLGVLDWNKLSVLQQEARFLINPRKNEGHYTKYSFPSKTMEYLASGTPVIAYKLDGIPDDYNNYIYWLEPGTVEEVGRQLDFIFSKSINEVDRFGKNAQEFVLSHKNNIVLTKKIIEKYNSYCTENSEI